MSRDLFGVEKGLRIYAENGDSRIEFLQGTLVPDGSGDQAAAPIGSLYARSGTGELYQKVANAGNPSDWVKFGEDSGTIGNWRPERVDALTGDVLAAGTQDPTSWTDNDGAFDGSLATAGHYVLDGACALYEIVTVTSATDIELALAGDQPVAQDMFAVRYYLPDPAGQEGQAIVTFDGTDCIKVADVDFGSATGVVVTSPYVPASGDVVSGDTVQDALQKIDGNNDAQDSVLGTNQGDTDLGVMGGTGTIITDNNSVKGALEELDDQVTTNVSNIAQNTTNIADNASDIADIRTLTGTSDGDTDLGTFTGDVISDNTTIKGALQELSDATEAGRAEFSGTVAQSTPTVVDSLLVDDYQIATWVITVRDTANPDRVKRQEINVIHNGSASSDATTCKESVSEKLNIGNVNLQVNCVLTGTGPAQTFGLEVDTSESSGIQYTVERVNFIPLAG